jgi:hypothetical protein
MIRSSASLMAEDVTFRCVSRLDDELFFTERLVNCGYRESNGVFMGIVVCIMDCRSLTMSSPF